MGEKLYLYVAVLSLEAITSYRLLLPIVGHNGNKDEGIKGGIYKVGLQLPIVGHNGDNDEGQRCGKLRNVVLYR